MLSKQGLILEVVHRIFRSILKLKRHQTAKSAQTENVD